MSKELNLTEEEARSAVHRLCKKGRRLRLSTSKGGLRYRLSK